MSINSKTNVKIIFKTILHILIFSIVSFIIFNLSFINTKKVGISTGILFSKEIYEINIIIFIICIASFILLYTFFWKEYLKKDLKQCKENHWSFIIIFITMFCTSMILEFIIILFTLGLEISWGLVSNFPVDVIYLIIFIYQLLFPIFDIIRDKLKQRKNKKEAL